MLKSRFLDNLLHHVQYLNYCYSFFDETVETVETASMIFGVDFYFRLSRDCLFTDLRGLREGYLRLETDKSHAEVYIMSTAVKMDHPLEIIPGKVLMTNEIIGHIHILIPTLHFLQTSCTSILVQRRYLIRKNSILALFASRLTST